MPSPFDRLTESDKLRSFVDTSSFAEDLASSNSTVFQAETQALGLQKQRNDIANLENEKNAKDAFAQNVITGAKDEADMFAKAQKFTESYPQYASSVPDLLSEGNKMFEGVSNSKLKNLQIKQQEMVTKEMEETTKLSTQAKNANNSLAVIQSQEAEFKIKSDKFVDDNDPSTAFLNLIDPKNPLHKSLYTQFNNDFQNSATDDQKKLTKKRYLRMFESLNSFRVVQNEFSTSTINEYSDTIAELFQKPEINKSYTEWFNKKSPEEKQKLAGSDLRIPFLADASVDQNNPISIGYRIKNTSADAAMLLNRTNKMISATNSYNAIGAMRDPKKNVFIVDQSEIDLAFAGLRGESDSGYASLKTEAEIKNKKLEERKLQATITNAENAQQNKLDTAVMAANISTYNRELSSARNELERNQRDLRIANSQKESTDPDKAKEAELLATSLEQNISELGNKIKSIQDNAPTTTPKSTPKAPE